MVDAKPLANSAESVGAVWRRWEPHIHTPGTALNNQYGNATLEDFCAAVEEASPAIEVLAVTDYCLTRKYEELQELKRAGRLSGVKLMLCNVELRYSIETKKGKGVNLHLLVSPDAPDHVEEINRFLRTLTFRFRNEVYSCTEADLRRLGRAHHLSGNINDETALKEGVNQFKVDFNQLKDQYEDSAWAKENILVAVAGSSNDGTAGLQERGAGFATTRAELEAFAHIIFASSESNIQFWQGDGILSEQELLEKYNGLKPCLHGSDAHQILKVGRPDDDRYCWIKGDATFDALKQACLEPRGRVWIGSTPPRHQPPFSVTSVKTPTLPWLVPRPQPINTGMVAIIGARGSGKTALADLIAHAGNSPYPQEATQSFLARARSHLTAGDVVTQWSDGTERISALSGYPTAMPDVHYLTQQFVDRLCSAEEESDELIGEIKRVVFLAHDPESRLDAATFDELAELRSGATEQAVAALNQQLDRLSQRILTERTWYLRREQLQRDAQQAVTELEKTERARQAIIKPGGAARAAYYTCLGIETSERQKLLQDLDRRSQSLDRLVRETERYTSEVFPEIQAEFERTGGEDLFTEDQWDTFLPQFSGDPGNVIETKTKELRGAAQKLAAGENLDPTEQMTAVELRACNLEKLKEVHAHLGSQIGADKKNIQRLNQLNSLQKTQETNKRRIDASVLRAVASAENLKEVLTQRADLYVRFFDLIIEQSDILNDLYSPLESQLATASATARKLSLRVVRHIDFRSWCEAGEKLLDLRKNGKFRGRGKLAEAAEKALLPAWKEGTAREVSAALEEFRRDNDESLLEQAAVERDSDDYQGWIIDLGRWLYSTEHIRVHYSIEYEGVPITQLSPGTRGIVLLLLYLALDLEDSRPLIIDQPEENLDPKSVFDELVPLFREARKRRQVVIVTHNANLVVNTDADQVIVASCTKSGASKPPQFDYKSGGLENPDIRADVCEILEGGAAAFRQRARRLRLTITD